jgi:hypothetical protein
LIFIFDEFLAEVFGSYSLISGDEVAYFFVGEVGADVLPNAVAECVRVIVRGVEVRVIGAPYDVEVLDILNAAFHVVKAEGLFLSG